MNKKMIGILVGVILVGGLIAAWFLHIRYAVEGGKVVWATRYAEPEAIGRAIEEEPEQSALDKALRIAVEDGDGEAAEILHEAGASINPDEKGFCQLASEIRFGRVEGAALALEVGADPSLCDVTLVEMMDDLLRFGHDNAPQAKIIEVMSALVDAGGDPLQSADEAGPSILALSEKYELDKVSKYLRAPDAYEAPEEGESLGRPKGVAGAVELDDLKKVCYGKGIDDAAPYEKSTDYAASVFYFEKRRDLWRYPGRRHGVTLPKWWTTWDEPANAQLVACVDLTEKTKVDTCHYEGRGGGVYVYEANVKVALREARTGNLVDEFSQRMQPARDCPNIKFGKDQEGIYPAYDEQLQEFLKPHVGGPK